MRAALILSVVVLSACVTGETERNQLEQGARPATEQIVSETYPALYVTPVSDCLISNASNEDLAFLMDASIKGVTGPIREETRAMLRRTEVNSCIRLSGIDPDLSATSPYSALSR